jgi:hypothetical protein
VWWLNKRGLTKETLVECTSIANSKLERRRRETNYSVQGLAFIASDALASVSRLNSDILVHVSSTWTGDIPPELSHYPPVEKSLFSSLYALAYCRPSCYSLLVHLPMPFAILVAFLEVLVLKRIVNGSLVTCAVSTLGWTLGIYQDLRHDQAILLGTAACLVLALTLVLLELYTLLL